MKSELKRLLNGTGLFPLVERTRRAFSRRTRLCATLNSGLKVRVENDSEWLIYNDIFVDGEYDAPIDQAIVLTRSSEEPIRVLDLGANVGFFSLRCVHLLRRHHRTERALSITAVEGNSRLAKTFDQRVLKENRLGDPVTLIRGLVGKRSGYARMLDRNNHGRSTIAEGSGHRVNFVDLYDVVSPQTHIDLLKCDIEGSELLFVENYADLLKRVSVAVFEFHPVLCDVRRCKDLIHDSGLVYHAVLREQDDFSVVHYWR